MGKYTNKKKTKSSSKEWNNTKKDFKKRDRAEAEGSCENDRRYRSFDNSFSNDPSWYKYQPEIFKQAVKIPFNRILGDSIRIKSKTQGSTASSAPVYDTTPGVMAVDFAPTIGKTISNMDAVNLAADRIYGYIYQQYTGAANFQKSDVIFQILHEVSIAYLIGAAKRGLRALYSYSPVNHNFARCVYAACGFSKASFDLDVQRYPQLVKRINKIILSFNSLYTPKITDLFEKWYALSSNIYADDQTVDSQLFLFRPMGWYEFVEAHDDGSGTLIPAQLQWIAWEGFNQTWTNYCGAIDDILDAAERLLDGIRNTSYFGIVNAAIGKAFSANTMLQIDPFLDGEILSPVFNKYINYQLNNALVTEWVTGARTHDGVSSSLNIVDDPTRNCIVCMPMINPQVYNKIPIIEGYYLNSYDGDTNEDFIIEATRLMPDLENSRLAVPSATTPQTIICGDMIPMSMEIYYINYNEDIHREDVYKTNRLTSFVCEIHYDVSDVGHFTYMTNSALTVQNVELPDLGKYSKFRNAPLIYVSAYGSSVPMNGRVSNLTYPDMTYRGTIGDLYKFTLINNDGIRGLHDVAWLSILTGVTDSNTK